MKKIKYLLLLFFLLITSCHDPAPLPKEKPNFLPQKLFSDLETNCKVVCDEWQCSAIWVGGVCAEWKSYCIAICSDKLYNVSCPGDAKNYFSCKIREVGEEL